MIMDRHRRSVRRCGAPQKDAGVLPKGDDMRECGLEACSPEPEIMIS